MNETMMAEYPTLEQKVTQMALEQIALNDKKQKLDELRAAWEAENAELIAEVEARENGLKELDQSIRNEAVKLYAQNGNKKPHAAVGIRVYKRTEYNPDAALAWAREHRQDMIALDSKLYDKVLKSDARDPGMPGEVVEEPRATIAKDLSEFVAHTA